jgi:hypothetical protein
MGAYDVPQTVGYAAVNQRSEYDVPLPPQADNLAAEQTLRDRICGLEREVMQMRDQHDAFVRDTVGRVLSLERRLG